MDFGKPSGGRAGGFLTPPQTRDGFRALTMLDAATFTSNEFAPRPSGSYAK